MAETDLQIVDVTVDKTLKFQAVSLEMRESLSQVPEYRVTALDQTTVLEDLVGKECGIEISGDEYLLNTPRSFSGIIMSAERVADSDGSPSLKLVVRPELAILGLSVHSAIYQKSTSLDILKEVLKRNGLARMKVVGTKPKVKRDTVIQYNENDLDFCQRILAEEGLTFYFNDGKSTETLVLHDVQKPFPTDFDEVKLTDLELSDVAAIAAQSMTLKRNLTPDKVELTHYDADKAGAAKAGPAVSSETKSPATPTVLEYRPVIVGKLKEDELKVLGNATQRPESVITGQCEHPAMHLGQALDYASTGDPDMNGKYIISAITYTLIRDIRLTCQFEAVPLSHIPAPKRLPKPLIAGVHNAIVVGSTGSGAGDVSCDDQGRVLVKFFWDKAKNDSGYIRVSEPYAGNGYGAQFIPRVGHEVLVSFLHGDPDAPIITGQVYTEKHKPPFIEKNSTRSGFRTQLEGEPNELEFDDKAGAELIGVRAAKDFELIVNEHVKRDIKMTDETKIAETSTLDIGDTWDITVKNAQTNEADQITLTGKTKITLKVGSSKIELTSSGIVIDAPKVEIKGKSKILADSKGALELKGMTSKLEAKTSLDVKGLNVSVKGSVQASFEGAMSEVKGSGMVTIKGAMTMIN